MSFDDCDVVADAKSPFSTSATDTPRSASSRATPAPAIPPPTTTTSYSASSSGQGRPCTGSGAPTPHRRLDHSLAPRAPAAAPLGRGPRRPPGAGRVAPAITVLPGDDGRQLRRAITPARALGSTGERDRAPYRRSARRLPA